jgi:DNA-directed RNA polymerase subunit RPC12/RpoP
MYKCFNCGKEYDSIDDIRAPGDTLSCKHCGGRIFLKERKNSAVRVKAH